jgi:hypothetical protein
VSLDFHGDKPDGSEDTTNSRHDNGGYTGRQRLTAIRSVASLRRAEGSRREKVEKRWQSPKMAKMGKPSSSPDLVAVTFFLVTTLRAGWRAAPDGQPFGPGSCCGS